MYCFLDRTFADLIASVRNLSLADFPTGWILPLGQRLGGSGAGGHFFLLLSGVSQRARLPTSTHLANGHGNKRSDKKFASHVTPARVRARTREETTKNVKIDWRRGYALGWRISDWLTSHWPFKLFDCLTNQNLLDQSRIFVEKHPCFANVQVIFEVFEIISILNR